MLCDLALSVHHARRSRPFPTSFPHVPSVVQLSPSSAAGGPIAGASTSHGSATGTVLYCSIRTALLHGPRCPGLLSWGFPDPLVCMTLVHGPPRVRFLSMWGDRGGGGGGREHRCCDIESPRCLNLTVLCGCGCSGTPNGCVICKAPDPAGHSEPASPTRRCWPWDLLPRRVQACSIRVGAHGRLTRSHARALPRGRPLLHRRQEPRRHGGHTSIRPLGCCQQRAGPRPERHDGCNHMLAEEHGRGRW